MQNVMIVEDDVMYRYAIRFSVAWEQEGFRICGEAINGKHALSMLELCKPNIVITDINMPEMNGLDLIAELHQHYPHIHILVLSSYDDFHLVRQALKSGAKDYLLKHDLDMVELAKILHEYLDPEDNKLTNGKMLSETAPQVRGTRHREIKKTIDYIKNHYSQSISLHQLADHLFLSPNYLCSLFKQETGLTIVEYIKFVRIEMTKELLETTQLRVYEIAEKVGFTNASYLCRVFKEMTGININEYKKMQQ